MYALYKDPEGKRVFDKTRPSDPASNGRRESVEHSNSRKGTLGSFTGNEKVISVVATVHFFVAQELYLIEAKSQVIWYA